MTNDVINGADKHAMLSRHCYYVYPS